MPDTFAYFGGIDFSGAREPLSNLWTVVGREDRDRLRVLSVRPHAFRADLVSYVTGGWKSITDSDEAPILWGVDFPFGIPRSVSAAMGIGGSWTSIVDWIADRPADEVRAAAGDAARAMRLGDTPGALPPLDLRLYKQTVEGLRWLQQVRESANVSIYPQAVVPNAPVTLIEVYPSGTAQELGLPRRRAPSQPAEAKARAAALRTFLDFDNSDCEAIVVNLEDAWDATIACLTAFLCREDLDQPLREAGTGGDVAIASEGWIFRPPAAISSTSAARSR
jgi:hypothetical protein